MLDFMLNLVKCNAKTEALQKQFARILKFFKVFRNFKVQVQMMAPSVKMCE